MTSLPIIMKPNSFYKESDIQNILQYFTKEINEMLEHSPRHKIVKQKSNFNEEKLDVCSLSEAKRTTVLLKSLKLLQLYKIHLKIQKYFLKKHQL